MHIEYEGLVDPETTWVIEEHERSQYPKAEHTFRLRVDTASEKVLGQNKVRLVEDFKGLPKSDEVVK
jgi:hypothetical protein